MEDARVDRSEARDPVLGLRGVTKSYVQGRPPAVADLDLDIESGEFFSILGPSGSGKTTTLRLIGGFETPDVGAVLLNAVDVSRVPPFKRDVSTVFQSYALFPHMTVERNVSYPLRMRKVPGPEAGRRVAEALELVSMGEFGSRLPHQLSGGQRQRVALARALVSRPRLVLLDEPLGALDLQLRQQMQLVLKQLQRDVGVTFVYVTHDQGEALAMSDRLAVMSEGRLEQLGTPSDVYFNPSTPFVASFIGKSNLLECEILGEEAVVGDGSLRLRVPPGYDEGTATLAIRFESVRLSKSSATNTSGSPYRAVVEEVIFVGDALEVVVGIAGNRLVAKCVSASTSAYELGDEVGIEVAPEDITVLYG